MQGPWNDSINWDDSQIWDESIAATTGEVALTLASFTVESVSKTTDYATFEIALGGVSIDSAGQASTPGVLNVSIGEITLSSTANVVISGSLAATLGAIVITSENAAIPIPGILQRALGAVTVEATAVNPIAGIASILVGSVTISAVGVQSTIAELAVELSAVTLQSASTSGLSGQVSVTLGGFSLQSESDVYDVAKVEQTLGNVLLSSSGSLLIAGEVNQTLDGVTLKPVTFGEWHGVLGDLTVISVVRPSITGTLGSFLGPIQLASTATIMPITLSNEDIDRISETVADRLYALLAGIRPSVFLTYDPATFALRLTQGDDYLSDDQRTIDIPITLPAGIVAANCTATFGAKRGTDRIDAAIAVYVNAGQAYARLTLPDNKTQTKPPGKYAYDIEVQHEGSNITVVSGVLTLAEGIAKDISEF